jgi:tetratricopeptide (TPR) repeat protein
MSTEETHIVQAWQRALSQPQQPWLAEAVDGLGDYYRLRGRYRVAEELFTETVKQIGEDGSLAALRGRLLVWKAVFAIARGETSRGESCLRESLAILEPAGVTTCRARAFAYLHLSNLEADRDLAAAVEQCQCAIDLFRACGDGRDLGVALGRMAEVQKRQGNAEMATMQYAVALHYLEEAGDKGAAAALLSKWAAATAEGGDLHQAIELARKAHLRYQHLQDRGSQARVLQQLGRLLIWEGKWDEAILLLREALTLYRDLGDRRRLPRAETTLALALVNQGEYAAASSHLETALSLAQQNHDQACGAEVYWLMGWVSLAAGRYHAAKEDLQRSVALYRGVQEQVGLSHALAARAYVEVRSGGDEDAKEWLIAALELIAEVRYPYSALVAVNTAALYLAARGGSERAVALAAMTARYAALAHSRLGHDCFMKPLMAIVSNMDPATVESARSQSAALRLWPTVERILEELTTSLVVDASEPPVAVVTGTPVVGQSVAVG